MNITFKNIQSQQTVEYGKVKPLSLFRWPHNLPTDVALKTRTGHIFLTDNDGENYISKRSDRFDRVILLDHELIIKGEL